MPAALLALAIGAFGIGTTEFVIMGLLPEVATDFGVSIPSAGLLISGYALGVVVGAPLLTAIGSKVSRKTVLISLMGVFIAGNLPNVSEIAPLLIVIRLEEFKYADATAIAVVMLLASFLILLAINRLQRWSELRAGRA